MPILAPHSTEYLSRSADQTRRAGMRLGSLLKTGDVIFMVGELGTGKTTLIQGVTAGWGSLDMASSPTFVLVNVYRRPDGAQLFHMDAYRMQDAYEAMELDIDAFLRKGPLVIEWADRIEEALPREHLSIHLHWIDYEQRDMMISATGKRYEKLLEKFRQRVFGVF